MLIIIFSICCLRLFFVFYMRPIVYAYERVTTRALPRSVTRILYAVPLDVLFVYALPLSDGRYMRVWCGRAGEILCARSVYASGAQTERLCSEMRTSLFFSIRHYYYTRYVVMRLRVIFTDIFAVTVIYIRH